MELHSEGIVDHLANRVHYLLVVDQVLSLATDSIGFRCSTSKLTNLNLTLGLALPRFGVSLRQVLLLGQGAVSSVLGLWFRVKQWKFKASAKIKIGNRRSMPNR